VARRTQIWRDATRCSRLWRPSAGGGQSSSGRWRRLKVVDALADEGFLWVVPLQARPRSLVWPLPLRRWHRDGGGGCGGVPELLLQALPLQVILRMPSRVTTCDTNKLL